MTEQIPGGPAPSEPNAGSPPLAAQPPGGAPAGPAPGYSPPPPGYAPPPPPGYAPPPPGYAPPPAGSAPQGPPPQGPPPGYAPQGPPPQGPPPGYAPPPGGYPPPPAPGYPGTQGGYAPPPAAGYPGAPGQPAGTTIQFDASKATTSDWIVIGAGVVLLIFSFFGWVSLGIFGSVGAWNQYWWIATVLGVAVAVVFALRVLFAQPLPQIKPMFLGIGAAAGLVVNLIALIQILISYTPGFSVWLCLIVAAAQTYFVWLWGQKQSDWTLPKVPGPANM